MGIKTSYRKINRHLPKRFSQIYHPETPYRALQKTERFKKFVAFPQLIIDNRE
jgi:hypothetical protein